MRTEWTPEQVSPTEPEPRSARVTASIDIDLLRQQRDWLLDLHGTGGTDREIAERARGFPACRRAEGLLNLLDHLLDVAEGYEPAGVLELDREISELQASDRDLERRHA